MENLKTETSFYNEDDFVQREGQLRELTVKITLAEYRNLVRECMRMEIENEAKDNKIEELEGEVKNLGRMLLDKCPDVVESIALCVKLLGGDDSGGEEEEEE